MSQGLVNDIKTDAQFFGFKNDRGVIPLCYDFPCKFIKIKWELRRCWLKKLYSSLFSLARPLSKNDTGGQNGPCFCFPQTVICYLLSVPQKFIYGNCQLSTVTLGIDDIDLSCDMMKNKPQKTWNISLLFVYLQRTMVQIQKLIFHILKDF